MRLAILSNPDSWYFQDLKRAAADRHELVAIPFSQLSATVQSDGLASFHHQQNDLRQFDAVLVRAMPPGSLEQIIFRMDLLGRLEAAGTLVVNTPRALECAVDKYLTTAKLAAAGLRVPRTIVCQTPQDALSAFEHLGRDVVVKPLFGSEGRGIARLTDAALAERAFRMLSQLGAVLYVQEFIPHHGYDLRLLVIGPKVLAMRRRSDTDWRTNVSLGGIAEATELTDELRELSLTAAEAVGATIAGVDILPGTDGKLYAIEVNAVPGWKALSTTLQVDAAELVLGYLEMQVRR
ncbi:MAG: RimK family alpha-L-glutamate ligase [Planctomycetota bacterium]|nr:RimK family alpha-L-glutamate ligase [Planctomycetota bacterium]